MPNEKVEYNFFMLTIAENYYLCNEKEKAREVISTMIKVMDEKLSYFNQFEGELQKNVENEVQRSLALYNSAVKIAFNFDDRDHANKLSQQFQEVLKNTDIDNYGIQFMSYLYKTPRLLKWYYPDPLGILPLKINVSI